MSYDVFISYCSDDKATADAVCSQLESRGIRCWIAPRDIQPGQQWAGAIIDAMDTVSVMVLLVTVKANDSQQVFREVDRAVNKGLVIIPVKLDDIKLSKNLEYYLSSPHWLNAVEPPLESHYEKLVETVGSVLNQAAEQGPTLPVDHSTSNQPTPPQPAPSASPVPSAASVTPGTHATNSTPSALKKHGPLVAVAVLLLAVVIGVWAIVHNGDDNGTGDGKDMASTGTTDSAKDGGGKDGSGRQQTMENGRPVFHVNNASALVEMIGPNRIVELEPGEYRLSNVQRLSRVNVRWQVALNVQDKRQYEMVIENVPNLTIRCTGGTAHLFVNEPYAYVLTFQNADNLTLSGLKMGHFPDPGYCHGGVVRVTDAKNVKIDNCLLYGCGTQGLALNDVRGFTFSNSVIEECTYGILSAEACENLTFERSSFRNNKEFFGFAFGKSQRVSFSECIVTNNVMEGPLFDTMFDITDPHGQAVAFVGGRIENNVAPRIGTHEAAFVAKDAQLAGNSWQRGEN